jgi:hypothetical protein
VAIRDNISLESYTLLYNNPLPFVSNNVVVTGNVVNVCSEFGALTAVAPHAFDMPSTNGLVISNNVVNKCDALGIGIFANSKNVLVSNNMIVDPMQMPVAVAWLSGICIGTETENVRVSNNTIVDTSTPSKMSYGILVQYNLVNISIINNIIRNPLTSRYGYCTTDVFPGSGVFTFTDPTQVSNTTHIIDTDEANRLTTEYGRRNIVGGISGSLVNYAEVLNNLGTISGTTNINLANGNFVIADLGGNTTFTFTTGIAVGAVSFTLFLRNATGGPYSIVWPVAVSWPGGVISPRTTADAKADIYTFTTTNNGTNWYGNIAQYNYS